MPGTRFASLVLCHLALAAAPALAASVMQPGGWELTSTITRELADQPAEKMGTHTMQLCLGPEFLAREPYLDPKIDTKKMEARNAKCSTADYERTGNDASWSMHCTLADGSTADARIRNSVAATTMRIHMVQDVQRPGGGQGRVTISGEGRHLGACTEGMSKP